MAAEPEMAVERIGVSEAKALLDEGYTYIDVRTPEEYAAGHPVGADNVPLMLRVEGKLAPNPDFVAVMRARYALDQRLVVGCAVGGRSLGAARALIEAGFVGIKEMRAGYAGRRDPFGQLIEKGWAAEGLPTELETPGGSYDEIRRALT